ncbi:MAG: PQQ-binding-like beta-propeller repeat protein [Chloroflexi bacterium]|nr:PQQ-binding-like beta-propeller repeat protein [Chloroflexota bacterium]
MECRRFAGSLSLLHDHRLSLGEDEDLGAHLAECVNCRQTLDDYKEINRELRRLPRTLPNSSAESHLFHAIRERETTKPKGVRGASQLTFVAAGLGSVGMLAVFGLMLLRVTLQVDEAQAAFAASTFVPPTPVPVAGGKQLYVVNQTAPGAVTIVDAGTNTLVKRIDLSFRPGNLTLDQKANLLYVAGGQGASAVIDTRKNEHADWLMLRYPSWNVVTSPNGSRVFAAHPFENLVSIMTLPDRSPLGEIRLDSRPFSLVAHPDGQIAYATTGSGKVYRIDTTSGTLQGWPVFGTDPQTQTTETTRPALGLAPDGRILYVAQLETGGVFAVNTETGRRRLVRLQVKGHARGVAVSPNGDRIYITYVNYNRTDTGGLLVLDARSLQEAARIDTGPYSGITVSPDGSTLYLTSQQRGTLSAFDAKALSLVGVVDAGNNPTAVVYKP